MSSPADEPRRRAAGRILALAQQFASRSREAQAGLIEEFQDAVREHVALLGTVSIEDDDDEQLVLDADGRFQGRVLVDSDGANQWEAITRPLDVIDHYDPVDLFSDLSDAIRDQVPDVLAGQVSGEPDRTGRPTDAGGGLDSADEPTESASRRVLRDLHDAGVYSDAEYAAKLAELDQPSGA